MTVSELLALAGARVVDDVRRAYAEAGPFTTVALDVGRAKEGAAHEVELRWRHVLHRAWELGASEHHVALLDACQRDVTTLPGQARRTLVAAASGLVLDVEHESASPLEPVVEVGALPTLVPLLGEATGWVPYVLVEAGRTAAAVHVRVTGRAGDWRREVVGEQEHVTKGHAGGWSDPTWQVHVEEVWRGNTEQVADETVAVVRATGVELVVVCGDVRVRPSLAAAVRPQVAAEVLDVDLHSLPTGASDDRVLADLRTAVRTRAASRCVEALGRVRADAATAGAVGVDQVTRCLQQGQVATLLLRPDRLSRTALVALDRAPWVGPPVGGAVATGIAPAAEVLARATLLTDADVLVTDCQDAELSGGVAAALRWERP